MASDPRVKRFGDNVTKDVYDAPVQKAIWHLHIAHVALGRAFEKLDARCLTGVTEKELGVCLAIQDLGKQTGQLIETLERNDGQ